MSSIPECTRTPTSPPSSTTSTLVNPSPKIFSSQEGSSLKHLKLRYPDRMESSTGTSRVGVLVKKWRLVGLVADDMPAHRRIESNITL